MPQAGFEPPSADDTSSEADALPTKPPRLVQTESFYWIILKYYQAHLKDRPCAVLYFFFFFFF